jgi:hypothetical protein
MPPKSRAWFLAEQWSEAKGYLTSCMINIFSELDAGLAEKIHAVLNDLPSSFDVREAAEQAKPGEVPNLTN